MEKFTIRDLATGKFKFKDEFDIVKVEDVESITIYVNEKGKRVVIHVGPFDYFFNRDLINAIKVRIKSDLSDTNTKYLFAV